MKGVQPLSVVDKATFGYFFNSVFGSLFDVLSTFPGYCMLAIVWWGWTVWPVRAGSCTPQRFVCWILLQELWRPWTSPSIWPSGCYIDKSHLRSSHPIEILRRFKGTLVTCLTINQSTLSLTKTSREYETHTTIHSNVWFQWQEEWKSQRHAPIKETDHATEE